jgi:hypothetical protein
MTTYTRLEIGLFIFLIAMVLLPLGLVLVVAEESPYHQVSGEPVNEAALATGITVTSVKDTTWNLPGASGGKIYVLTDNNGEVVTVSTQSFDSAQSREAAIRLHNAHQVGRGKTVGSLIVLGQQLIYVTPANSNILKNLAPELKKRAAP